MGASPGTFISLISLNSFNPNALERWKFYNPDRIQERRGWYRDRKNANTMSGKKVWHWHCLPCCPPRHISVGKDNTAGKRLEKSPLSFPFQAQSLGTVFHGTGNSRRGLKSLERYKLWYKLSYFPARQHTGSSERKKVNFYPPSVHQNGILRSFRLNKTPLSPTI